MRVPISFRASIFFFLMATTVFAAAPPHSGHAAAGAGHPMAALPAALKGLIEKMGSDTQAERDRATKELEKHFHGNVRGLLPLLLAERDATTDAEVRKRLRGMLSSAEGPIEWASLFQRAVDEAPKSAELLEAQALGERLMKSVPPGPKTMALSNAQLKAAFAALRLTIKGFLWTTTQEISANGQGAPEKKVAVEVTAVDAKGRVVKVTIGERQSILLDWPEPIRIPIASLLSPLKAERFDLPAKASLSIPFRFETMPDTSHRVFWKERVSETLRKDVQAAFPKLEKEIAAEAGKWGNFFQQNQRMVPVHMILVPSTLPPPRPAATP